MPAQAENLDALRSRVAQIEQRNANIDAAATQAGTAARLTETRRAYRDDVDAAHDACEAAEAQLARVAAAPATLEQLFAAFIGALRADGRRHGISAATAGELGTLDELPQNPMSGAYQTRQPRYPRLYKGQSFAEFVDSTVERWVAADMAAADRDFRSGLAKIADDAEANARAAAEQTPDGHTDIDVPQSFQEKYDDAVAQLANPNGTDRLKVQRAMFLEETGGRAPTIL
jgi:hypothetical protein